jgi:hypothetical protein
VIEKETEKQKEMRKRQTTGDVRSLWQSEFWLILFFIPPAIPPIETGFIKRSFNGIVNSVMITRP